MGEKRSGPQASYTLKRAGGAAGPAATRGRSRHRTHHLDPIAGARRAQRTADRPDYWRASGRTGPTWTRGRPLGGAGRRWHIVGRGTYDERTRYADTGA